MVFAKIMSVFGLRSLPTEAATAKDVNNTVDAFEHITKDDIAEPVTQECSDGLLVIMADDAPAATPAAISAEKIATARAAIACCVQVCLSLLPAGSEHWRDFLREGFYTLHDCANVLQDDVVCMVLKHKDVLRNLYITTPYHKKALHKALTVLLDGVDPNDFEIAPVVWALLLGPLPLAAGIAEGKEVCEILLGAEEKWAEGNLDTTNYKKKKAALLEFAEEVSVWAEYVKGMTAGCEAKEKP